MKIKKTYEVSPDGRITVYPSLFEKEEKRKINLFLKQLLQFFIR